MTVISVLSIMSVPAVLNTDTNSHVKMVSYALKAQENLLLVLLDTTVRTQRERRLKKLFAQLDFTVLWVLLPPISVNLMRCARRVRLTPQLVDKPEKIVCPDNT
jgi:hypothetical protein